MSSIDWPAFVEIIHANQTFVLTSHIRPDCDALGSELGMAGVLRTLGKDVQIVNGQRTPPNLSFIDPAQEIRVFDEDVKLEELVERDVLMILDTSAWAQLGPMGEVVRGTKGKKLVVDHHVSEDEMGAIAFKNTSAEATGRLVMEAADQLGVELTPSMAKPLFAAIATDTGWFRFGSADASTYRHAAKLIDSGARPDEIYGSLYEQDKLGRIRLRGMVLERIHTEMDGDLGYTYIGRDDFARLGALPSDTEDLVNMVLAVQGIKVAAIFIQQIDGGFKISFRSRCHVDCSELASKFGGGGHRAAAGAFVDGELDEVKSVVLDAVREAMR